LVCKNNTAAENKILKSKNEFYKEQAKNNDILKGKYNLVTLSSDGPPNYQNL
jgi:hypothetical protein